MTLSITAHFECIVERGPIEKQMQYMLITMDVRTLFNQPILLNECEFYCIDYFIIIIKTCKMGQFHSSIQ